MAVDEKGKILDGPPALLHIMEELLPGVKHEDLTRIANRAQEFMANHLIDEVCKEVHLSWHPAEDA